MPLARKIHPHAGAPGLRGLLAVPALLGMLALLAAGCEYLDNLTETKTPDKGDLSVLVVDAWTGETLQLASCGDASGSWSERADGTGHVAKPGLTTGTHDILCSCTGYFERTYKVDVKLAGTGTTTVSLARMGGDFWYPEERRRVSFELLDGNLRFPGKMRLQAYPADSTGIFQYDWTSSYHKNLAGFTKSILSLSTPTQTADTLEVALTLRVRATLAGRTYDVGNDSQVFVIKRNQLPTLTISRDVQDSIKVGCGTKYLSFVLYTKDPDGICQSVNLISNDPTSSLGVINETRSCGQGDPVLLQLKAHSSIPGLALSRENALIVRVADDNEYRDSVITLTTFSVLPQEINLVQADTVPENFAQTPLRFRIQASGGNSGFDSLLIDWKDGSKPDTINLAPGHFESSYDKFFMHTFSEPGTYEVQATLIDKCDSASSTTLIVPISPKQLPMADLAAPGGIPAAWPVRP